MVEGDATENKREYARVFTKKKQCTISPESNGQCMCDTYRTRVILCDAHLYFREGIWDLLSEWL
jgi:hypothetical protein